MAVKLDLTLREEHRLRAFQNRVLRRMLEPKFGGGGEQLQELTEDCMRRFINWTLPHGVSWIRLCPLVLHPETSVSRGGDPLTITTYESCENRDLVAGETCPSATFSTTNLT
jgi:hypothetical protein